MDKLDTRLLAELDSDPGQPITGLARKLRVSQQVADYRLKRLIKDGVISKFGAIINLKALGGEHYRVFFTFDQSKFSPDKLFAYLNFQDNVYWAACAGGRYDLLVVLFVKDFAGFDEFIERFNRAFPRLIKDYKACYGLDHILFRHKFLSGDRKPIRYGYDDSLVNIDDLDRHILTRLKDDCRLSSIEIAKGTSVSYKTVMNRIKALRERKVILGERLFLKESSYKPFILLVSFQDYDRDAERSLLNYLAERDEVTQVVRMFGVWNLFIHLRAADLRDVQRVTTDLRSRFFIINTVEIIPVFEDISINLLPYWA